MWVDRMGAMATGLTIEAAGTRTAHDTMAAGEAFTAVARGTTPATTTFIPAATSVITTTITMCHPITTSTDKDTMIATERARVWQSWFFWQLNGFEVLEAHALWDSWPCSRFKKQSGSLLPRYSGGEGLGMRG